MAPRRGGSSGGGGSSVSISSCSDNAFATEASRVWIAFSGVFLLVYFVLFIYTAARLKKRPLKGLLLSSLLLALVSEIASIIVQSLRECDVLENESANNSSLAISWLWWVGVYLLIAAIMVPLPRKLGASKITVVALGIFLVLLGLLQLADLSVHSMYVTRIGERNEEEWRMRDLRLGLATSAAYLLGILLTSTIMFFSLHRDQAARNGARKTKILLLIIAAIFLGLFILAYDAYVYVRLPELMDVTPLGRALFQSYFNDLEAYNRTTQALSFLKSFFYAITVLSAVVVAASFVVAPAAYQAPYPVTYGAAPDPKYA